MIVLGINETHCATAALLRDGAIVGCASEERFSRLKNDAGYPRAAADALLLTNANSGDGLCATATTAGGIALTRREAAPSAPGSLGSFYSFVTLLLGMRAGEHEYKVMGLAPYAPPAATERAARALRQVFDWSEGDPALFGWKRRGPRYRLLLESTLGLRFDAIAGGAQRVLE